jgi:hypothetical protein
MPPLRTYIRLGVCGVTHETAAQLLCAAIHRYPPRSHCIIPGIFASHTSGRPHQISRANATAASAPRYWLPSESKNRISRSNSASGNPSNALTLGSCKGANPSPRLPRIGASHRAIRVQNTHSASKNSHPRACRPLPSVNSDASEIMILCSLLCDLCALLSVPSV